ncbi:MAG TPA: CARDB domain-containing protein [Pyrinomonadaceae bacterium]|nr:CARDB domain-containing protein [Pyrinomonadaceae bacterium]
MARKSVTFTGLLVLCFIQPLVGHTRVPELPDLKIRQYEFVSTNDKWVRVELVNEGKVASSPCQLELAIRKINGVGATRSTHETVPAIKPGREEWVTIDASGILQSATNLKEHTSFRLRVDETKIVAESNEDNNELWHHPN